MPRCKLPDCPVAVDGRCLEGRGETCPNLIPDEPDRIPEEEAQRKSRKAKTQHASSVERLYSGLPLEVSDAREHSYGSRSIVVALVGLRDSGKTSLLARLHQLFQLGNIGDF